MRLLWPPSAAAACCLVAVAGLVSAQPAHGGRRIRVRGASRVEARSVATPGGLQLRGTLVDDVGAPVSGGSVRIRLAGSPGQSSEFLSPRACPKSAAVRCGENEVLADADPAGRFCVEVDRSAVGATAYLVASGTSYHEPSEPLALKLDASRSGLELRFAPPPRELSLDRPSHVVTVEARFESAEPPSQPLHLTLVFTPSDGAPIELGSQTVMAGEQGRFEVASERLGGPGPGTLAVIFAGSDVVQAAQERILVQRTARVALSVAARLDVAEPSRGVTIPVGVGSTLGAVSSGAVEATVDGQSVGVAPVVAGGAQVVARFDGAAGTLVPVSLRYLPDQPWWRTGPAVETQLEIGQPSPWRFWPWALSVLAVAAWVVRGAWRPRRRERSATDSLPAAPTGRASVEVLERGPARGGWHGRVVDAHEGSPVARARVSIVVPTFGAQGDTAAALTDDAGQFTLAALSAVTSTASLRVSSTWHAELVRPVPPPGHLQINVVTRRRALLGRLVDWADRMGYPWQRRGEPTPGEVRETAATQGMTKIARWAGSVEVAAFGPEAVDEAKEVEVHEQEPHWKRGDEAGR